MRRGGHAASLASATRRKVTGNYGQFLWWLQDTSNLDFDGDPARQMTRDLMAGFIIERRQAVSDNSTYFNVRNLAMMMKCLTPEHEWRWIWQLSVVPRLWEARAARRPVRLFPAGLLMHRLLAALQEAIATPLDRLAADRVRDCLLVVLAIILGLWLRNIAAMRLEHNFIRRKAGWEIMFEGYEVKNGEAFLYQVPSLLNPFIDRYLSVGRLRLMAGRKIEADAVWVGQPGPSRGRLMANRIREIFNRIGNERLGHPTNPHSVRHVAATRILDNDPRALGTAAFALRA